jgi:hypothetical protein
VTLLRRGPQVEPLLRRGAFLGASGGFLLGGAAGTWAFPFVGTFWVGIPGGALGAVVGVLTSLSVLLVSSLSAPRWALGAGGALVCGGLAASVMGVVRPPAGQPGGLPALVIAAGVFGACLGPLIASGPATAPGARWPDHAAVAALAKPVLLGGLGGGATVGGLVGLAIGLATYLPTSPVAMVEGAVLGGAAGLFLAVIVVSVMVGLRIRMRVRP